MSLKEFHIIFVVAAIFCSIAFGYWAVQQYVQCVFGNFIFATLVFAQIKAVYACSVCFGGASDDPMNTSLRWAVLFLLGVVFIILGIFAKFFLNIRRRAKLLPQK